MELIFHMNKPEILTVLFWQYYHWEYYFPCGKKKTQLNLAPELSICGCGMPSAYSNTLKGLLLLQGSPHNLPLSGRDCSHLRTSSWLFYVLSTPTDLFIFVSGTCTSGQGYIFFLAWVSTILSPVRHLALLLLATIIA